MKMKLFSNVLPSEIEIKRETIKKKNEMKYGLKNGTFSYSAKYFCPFTGSRTKDINVLDLDDKGSWFRLH